MKAARTKVRRTAGPASEMAEAVPRSRPVPIEPPTATIVICPAVSWRRRPDSGLDGAAGMERSIRITEDLEEGDEARVGRLRDSRRDAGARLRITRSWRRL